MSGDDTTRSTTKDALRVYTIERAEKISYLYHIPARSRAEALSVFDSETGVDEYMYKAYDTHDHYRYYKPRVVSVQTSLDDFDHIEGVLHYRNGVLVEDAGGISNG